MNVRHCSIALTWNIVKTHWVATSADAKVNMQDSPVEVQVSITMMSLYIILFSIQLSRL